MNNEKCQKLLTLLRGDWSFCVNQGTELELEYVRSRIQVEEFQMWTRMQRTRIRFEIGGNEQWKWKYGETETSVCQSGDRISTRIRKISNPVRRISNEYSNTKNSNPVWNWRKWTTKRPEITDIVPGEFEVFCVNQETELELE